MALQDDQFGATEQLTRVRDPLVLLPGHYLKVEGDSAASQVLIVEMQKDPQMRDGKRIREKGSDSFFS